MFYFLLVCYCKQCRLFFYYYQKAISLYSQNIEQKVFTKLTPLLGIYEYTKKTHSIRGSFDPLILYSL